MKSLFQTIGTFTVAATASLFCASSNAELMVIGHSDLASVSLSAKEVRALYLSKPTRELRKEKLLLVTPAELSAAFDPFYQDILHMTPGKYQSRVAAKVFTGKGMATEQFDTDNDALNYVRETEGAIAIVDFEQPPQGASVLYRHSN